MKFTEFTLLAILISSALTGSCAKSCQYCKDGKSGQECKVCFRKLLQNGACKGGVPNNCDVALGPNFCYRCSAGYILNGTTGQCQLTTIAKCASGYLAKDGSEVCEFCVETSPGNGGADCSGSSQIKNCLWEGVNKSGPKCARCRDGHMSKFNKCVFEVFGGCLELDSKGYCIGCNVFEGYFMTKPGHCHKGSADMNKVLFSKRR